MSRLFFVLVSIAGITLTTGASSAQPEEFVFERILVPGDIGANRLTAIVQGRQGFLWIGTGSGIYRYDGVEFEKYALPGIDESTAGTDEKASVGVWDLDVDEEGQIWIATYGFGSHRFDPVNDEWISFRHDPVDPNSIASDTVYQTLVDHNGMVWIGTESGLSRLDPMSWGIRTYKSDPYDSTALRTSATWTLHEGSDGTLWVGTVSKVGDPTDGGLHRYDPEMDSFIRYPAANPQDEQTLIDPRVSAILDDEMGRLWIGTFGHGLHTMEYETERITRHRYSPQHPELLAPPYPVSGNYSEVSLRGVKVLFKDRGGLIWIGAHGGGINVYDPIHKRISHSEWQYANQRSLSNNNVWSIGGTHDGVVWVGNLTHGLHGLHKAVPVPSFRLVVPALNRDWLSSQWQRIPREVLTRFNYIYAIEEARDGTIWVGSRLGGLAHLDRDGEAIATFRPLVDRLGPESDLIQSIEESHDGRLWIGGSRSGLTRFDPRTKKFEHFRVDPGDSGALAENDVHAIFEDRDGMVWIGTHHKALSRFDPRSGAVKHFGVATLDGAGLSHEFVGLGTIMQSADGSIWVGTRGGLDRINPESGAIEHFFGLGNQRGQITGLVEAKDGSIWISSWRGGIDRVDPTTGAVTSFNDSNSGIGTNKIFGILADQNGGIWLSAEHSIVRMDVDKAQFHTYPLGLVGSVDSLNWEGLGFASFESARGELFFGGVGGFQRFRPEAVMRSDNDIPPKVALTSLQLFDEPVEPGDSAPIECPISIADEVVFQDGQDVFSFQFVALHYTDPKRNRLVYMLEGYDDGWREADQSRTARYYHVPAGSYRFKVMAANPFGIWSEPTIVAVKVLPPWWLSWWAYSLYVCAIGLSLYLMHWMRVRTLQARAQALDVLVDERTSALHEANCKTEEQARRLIELDALKDRFFFNISHEFRTPLTLVLGPLEDALSGVYGALAPALRQQMLVMQRNGRRLHRLISQLLDLARLEVGRMPLQARARDLTSFVKFIARSFSPLAERRRVSLKFTAQTDELRVYFDADKLEHVITNLLSNAFKFTSENGMIEVNVSRVNMDGREYAEISVTDNGAGIPAEELPFVFDRFHQVEPSSNGSGDGAGIGLALAKEIVDLHHGQIKVESTEGIGTVFYVWLPLGKDHLSADELADESAHEDPEDLAYSEPAWVSEAAVQEHGPALSDEGVDGDKASDSSGRPTVLIVEDNGDVRDYLKGHLTGIYEVLEAANGKEGLEIIRQARPDLVVADVTMPGMDGYTLCKTIKADSKLNHIPVVLLTARATEDAEIEGLEAGADDYILKPFSADAVLARIENLIEIRRLLRERFSSEVSIEPTGVVVKSQDAAFLEQVREAIESQISNYNFTVQWLADEVGVSTRQLHRKLRELVNLSPSGYIRMIRLERALQLLEQKGGNVSEVAFLVGFNDPRYFSRLFQQTFGFLPSSIRDR